MSEKSNDVSSLTKLIKKILKWKGEEEAFKLVKYSIIERLLMKMLFDCKLKMIGSQDVQLLGKKNSKNEINYQESDERISSSQSKTIFGKLKEELHRIGCLDFYKKLIDEINKIKNEYSFENYIRIEPMIIEHFKKNFFDNSKDNKNKIDHCFFNDTYAKTISEIYSYDYSICSLSIMFKILKMLEIQNLNLNDQDEVKCHGFISEKNLKNKDTKPMNIIEVFINGNLQAIMTDLYDNKNQANNYELENKICLSLFIIKKIIKDYSFYFDKYELEKILKKLKKFKDWPFPIGALGMELFEILINEIYFQGITVLNQLRNTYLIDRIDPTISKINISDFNNAYLIFSGGEDGYNSDESKILIDVLSKSKTKNNDIDTSVLSNSSKRDYIVIREFLVKIFITLIRNSNFSEITKENMTKFINKTAQDNDNTYNCLTKLLKIIDVGLDKKYGSFLEDIEKIKSQLLKKIDNYPNYEIKINNLPITEYRSYKCPKIILSKINKGEFEIFKQYFEDFKKFYNNNFIYLNEQIDEDMKIKNKKLRFQIFQDFKLKIVLLEEKKILSDFINQMFLLYHHLDNLDRNCIINEENYWDFVSDFENFWSKFFDNFKEIDINFLLFVVPWNDDHKHHSANMNNPEDIPPTFSEFLSGKDNIYLNLIYNTWFTQRSSVKIVDEIKWNEFNDKNKNIFPTDDYPSKLFNYLKDPLKLYMTEASSVFNLNLYKITIFPKDNDPKTKLFWRSCEIIFDHKPISQNDKTKKEINNGTLKIFEGDEIDSKESDEPIEVTLTDIVNIKRDVPFYFNNTSNNESLEIILQEYCLEKNLKKIKKIIYSNMDDFVMSQIEMNSIHNNYQGSKIELTSETGITLKIDDEEWKSDSPFYINKIIIEKYIRNGKHVSLPVATFVPILN